MARKQGNPPTIHTVEAGDILFDIAQAYYGDGNQWQKISMANGNVQPQSLQVGQKLQIPTVGSPNPQNGYVVVYNDSQYRGSAQTLSPGRYDWGQIRNDTISSLKVPAGMKVTLYSDTRFSGQSKTFTTDTAYVGNDFNDKTSSIIVEFGSSSPAPNAQAQELLAAHNRYRAEVGVSPLRWSNSLAASAQQWANHLAATGALQHSRAGENLAQATAGSKSITQLVDMWGAEKQNFRNGTFPNISITGNWQDVGHYSQIVWRNTTEVGCGLARGSGNDVLVCHYNAAGNVQGQAVF